MRHRALLTALLIAAAAVACSAPSAEDLVAEVLATRNEYDVALSSWIDRNAGTPQASLYLDVNVVKNTEENLTHLTVLVEQLDADNNVLDSQRVAIDVSDLDTRGLSRSYGLEVSPLAAGVEGVRLIVEPNPPADVWDEFPELERVRPRGR
jgi:hypothetical protein